jgi:hypothetical protein
MTFNACVILQALSAANCDVCKKSHETGCVLRCQNCGIVCHFECVTRIAIEEVKQTLPPGN